MTIPVGSTGGRQDETRTRRRDKHQSCAVDKFFVMRFPLSWCDWINVSRLGVGESDFAFTPNETNSNSHTTPLPTRPDHCESLLILAHPSLTLAPFVDRLVRFCCLDWLMVCLFAFFPSNERLTLAGLGFRLTERERESERVSRGTPPTTEVKRREEKKKAR